MARKPGNPERAAFIRAILESPDDDTARLVFADWADEHGEEDRGTLIRMQCAFARLHPLMPGAIASLPGIGQIFDNAGIAVGTIARAVNKLNQLQTQFPNEYKNFWDIAAEYGKVTEYGFYSKEYPELMERMGLELGPWGDERITHPRRKEGNLFTVYTTRGFPELVDINFPEIGTATDRLGLTKILKENPTISAVRFCGFGVPGSRYQGYFEKNPYSSQIKTLILGSQTPKNNTTSLLHPVSQVRGLKSVSALKLDSEWTYFDRAIGGELYALNDARLNDGVIAMIRSPNFPELQNIEDSSGRNLTPQIEAALQEKRELIARRPKPHGLV